MDQWGELGRGWARSPHWWRGRGGSVAAIARNVNVVTDRSPRLLYRGVESGLLSWRLSDTLDTLFCIDALKEALAKYGAPEIFNSDQGCRFTSTAFTSVLINRGITISMDSKGRALDNIMIERFWRTIKYEYIYINEYNTVKELTDSIERYIYYYNIIRRHSSIGNETPDKVYK